MGDATPATNEPEKDEPEKDEPEKGTGAFCRSGPPAHTGGQRWTSHKRCLPPFPITEPLVSNPFRATPISSALFQDERATAGDEEFENLSRWTRFPLDIFSS